MSMSSVVMDESLPRPFKCATCKKGFTRQENLKRHVNTREIEQCVVFDASGAESWQIIEAEMLPAFPAISARLEKATCRKLSRFIGVTAQNSSSPSSTVYDAERQRDRGRFAKHGSMDGCFIDPSPAAAAATATKMSSEIRCVEAFFDCFHQNFPILHEGSFHIVSTQVPLLNVITAIGSLYCESTFDESTRKAVFESTLSSLQQYVEQNRSRYQETWVLQTFLLLEFLGIYGGNDSSFLKAQRIHRDLIDAIRLLQMSQDSSLDSLSTNSAGEDSGYGEECDEDDMQEPVSADALNDQWQGFIKKESRKRCVYMLYLLDSQLAILCNLRPMLSSLEIKYDLPCCEDIWLARSDRDWYERRRQRFKSFDEPDDNAYAHETPPSQGFFYEASQTLLHSGRGDDKDAGGGKNQPRKLRLLWASPFAAVILVTQLQMMARELTHASCLLERPKAQRRALSILTDKQHAQISQALKGIAELVPRNQKPVFSFFDFGRMDTLLPDSSDQTPLWHTFWILWYYTSITLSHPDSLLVSGVVESNLPLAIASHLATPRSKDKRDIYEDRDVFRILNDLEMALDLLNPSKSTAPPSLENPFITLLGFKICLVGWRLVRLTMPAAQRSSDALHGPGGMGIGMAINTNGRSNPSRFVLDAIMACVDSVGDDDVENAAAALAMLDGGPVDLARSEVRFLEWIVANFNKRTTWPVGKWVATVMEESLSKAREAYAVPMSE
ncbi:early growth response protein 1 (egr-1) [Colletotrichum tabaci]|uniref:Early growth response protein 1 (Egr-1) n=1 Tax=Colletotrichum tabaci TaxID=1209068 RepID=A0AAV9SWJ0_9PEZI